MPDEKVTHTHARFMLTNEEAKVSKTLISDITKHRELLMALFKLPVEVLLSITSYAQGVIVAQIPHALFNVAGLLELSTNIARQMIQQAGIDPEKIVFVLPEGTIEVQQGDSVYVPGKETVN